MNWTCILPQTNPVRRAADQVTRLGIACSMPPAQDHRMDNAQLIRAAQQGDCTAFEQLVQRYDRLVLRLTVHLTGSEDDGQDIYQEAFLRAYINLSRFRFECSFYTWIYRIATNLCLDHLRRKRIRSRELTTVTSSEGEEQNILDRIPDQSAGTCPERNLENGILRERIFQALGKLSPRERVVFELKHYRGLQLKTVAGILQTTEGTAKNTLFRATHKLRLELSEMR